MKKLTKRDYKKITKFYKSKKHTRKNALKTISRKFCSCVEKVKAKKKGEAIGICTKSVINRKGFKRGKFSCKSKPSIQLYKGGKRRKKKTRKKRGGMTLEEIGNRINVLCEALTYWSNLSDNHPSTIEQRILTIFKISSEMEKLLLLKNELVNAGRTEVSEKVRKEPNLKKHGGRRTRKRRRK